MIVETFDGSSANRKNCRFIKGNFYIQNKQCFEIGGVWYRVNSGMITFDNEQQKWVVTKSTPGLIKGIIGYDGEKQEFILGSFTPNSYRNVVVSISSGSYTCMSADVLPSTMFKEDVRNMIFVPISTKTRKEVPQVNFGNHGYPFQPQYCVKHYDQNMMDMFKSVLDKPTQNPMTKIATYASALGKFSFGFEFESNRGKIPNYRILDSGLIPLRDGSITGIEYATIPLSGKKGISILETACMLLQRYTTFTEQESLHLHLGNIPTSKAFIGYLYTVCCILEKDVYSMFPKYYAQTSKFKARGKDYNMPLKKEMVAMTPEETFDNVGFYLSSGKKYQGFGAAHPSDPEGNHKWGINERYHWVNFIPLLFGDNKTLEFRCHVPTNDPVKVINWLFLCAAIVQYAEKAFKKNVDLNTLKHLSLKSVVMDVYSYELAFYLADYIAQRKANRSLDESVGDYSGRTEIHSEISGKQMYKDIS